jgi:UDP:flavonoid glycosyltransferase YjiC (YdhE family)
LIFAEAVTLAHVARPIALARVLRALGHDVCIAAAASADRWLDGERVARARIHSIESSRFLHALARGVPAYDTATLTRYVEDDLRAIDGWAPDIVVGDFRLSLYISARRAGRPYGAIANAYWSRRYWSGVTAPDVPPLARLPQPVADALFRLAYPAAFALHARPFHRACRAFGVASPGPDIRDVYTASDATAFADVEAFYDPSPGAAAASSFVGPLPWEPPAAAPLPPFPDGPPIVFVALGSSGPAALLPRVLQALAGLPLRCIVATGTSDARMPGNCIHAASFVPYAPASDVASLVICNGGAPATYAALGRGRPVLALPANLDQLLNARVVVRLGAARLLPAARADGRVIARMVGDAIGDEAIALRARQAGRIIERLADPSSAMGRWLDRLSSRDGRSARPLGRGEAVRPRAGPAVE